MNCTFPVDSSDGLGISFVAFLIVNLTTSSVEAYNANMLGFCNERKKCLIFLSKIVDRNVVLGTIHL